MYQITVKYRLTSSQQYEARIATRLPSVPGQGIERAYIDSTVKFHGESLDYGWGVGAGVGLKECRCPVTITEDTVEELAVAVSAQLFEIQKTIHEVYVARIDKQALVPEDISLDINPAILRDDRHYEKVELDFAIIELNNWRNRIAEGDKIKIWESQSGPFYSGFVISIDRSAPLWELSFHTEEGTDENLDVSSHELFPYFLSEEAIAAIALKDNSVMEARHAEAT
jgi:hypothetical protein